MKSGLSFYIIVMLFCSISGLAQPSGTKNVILIGISGVSAEAFQYANTPVINRLVSQGAVSLKTRGVMPLLSAPNWATVLSGAGPEQHGVTSKSWNLANQGFDPTVKDADGYFTSVFTLISRQLPNIRTAMFYDWEWLGSFVNKKYISKEQYVQGHIMITSVALNYIRNEKPVFTFIYYGLPGQTGESKGYNSKEYYQSINEIDAEIGKLIAGLQELKIAQNTTILITSASGYNDSGRAVESMPEIEVPWIISGPGISKNILLELPNDLANTAPTIARILGLKIPAEWIGKPVNEAFSTNSNASKSKMYIPKPWCSLADGAFQGPQQVELLTSMPGAAIYYTLDGTTPGTRSKKYTSPFTVSQNCTLKAVCISGTNASQVITRIYTFVQGIKSASLTYQPDPKYPGSGLSGLFDGLIGSANPGNKQWMGFEGGDFEVTVDLGEVKTINAMGIDVLLLPESLIFLPASVEFYTSDDGKNYSFLSTLYASESEESRLDGPVMLSRVFDNLQSRFIRIKAKNTGTCPPNLPCKGQKAWLFVSEVEIE